MRLVIVESPFSSSNGYTVESNIEYARRAIRDCLQRGEAPIASHLLFTQPGVLDDNVPEERQLGCEAGWAWYETGAACAVYADRGISTGMQAGIDRAIFNGASIEYRHIGA